MNTLEFSDNELQILRSCLTAAGTGEFIDEHDLDVIYLVTRSELDSLGAGTQPLDLSDPQVMRLTKIALNSLIMWFGWMDLNPDEAEVRIIAQTNATIAILEQLCERLNPNHPQEFTRLSVCGPVQVGSYFYRIIEYHNLFRTIGGEDREYVTHSTCQIWRSGQWLRCNGGPGQWRILDAPPTPPELLAKWGVDTAPLLKDYDPKQVVNDPEYVWENYLAVDHQTPLDPPADPNRVYWR